FMECCLALAIRGLGKVAPNPMVGSVVVHRDKIVSEGFHALYGGPHAEVGAISGIPSDIPKHECILYVNLEPCAHTGKTPPCTSLILESGIQHVVFAVRDPFEKVNGAGSRILREHGVRVQEGVLESKARFLNRRFFTFTEQKRPYIILKWAETSDGFIARQDYSSKWISCELSRRRVHQWRSQEVAVLVGTNTALYDNPKLTCRDTIGKNPIRIATDRRGVLPKTHSLFDQTAPTIVFTEKSDAAYSNAPGVDLVSCGSDFNKWLTELYRRGIQSIIVEGGGKLLSSFLENHTWDEIRRFRSRENFVSGIAAPKLPLAPYLSSSIGEDTFELYFAPRLAALIE
ncbi:MAG: bifunctional diaminohydroxyphosphoribosylaminopyrimidine deaminase/5-amino-6-(5-phosphoribosylamino)uracil reductase RibD, partial [Bdellovibrionales bacterium]|nr:bifunctional diaminohydroxyphosphoribosylaminopyrimidine deaminase/5-amino-6-(5-phosphoribosylamino)uracil reductase RibD [Bdellovibrionales bacterium]